MYAVAAPSCAQLKGYRMKRNKKVKKYTRCTMNSVNIVALIVLSFFAMMVYWSQDARCTELAQEIGKAEKEFKRPVFVTDYPKEIKAFYMKLNDDGKTVAAMDCLVPGIGEIIGGSQREEDLDKLEKRMDELGLDKEGYQFYLDLRRYGSVRHAGFGLGFERCVMYLTGMGNIRDVLPFPRTVGNCEL